MATLTGWNNSEPIQQQLPYNSILLPSNVPKEQIGYGNTVKPPTQSYVPDQVIMTLLM